MNKAKVWNSAGIHRNRAEISVEKSPTVNSVFYLGVMKRFFGACSPCVARISGERKLALVAR